MARSSFSGSAPPSSSRRAGSRRLSEHIPKALGLAACCMGCVVLWLLWGAGGSSSSSSSGLHPRYEAAAAANITAFRNRLLGELLPTFSTRVNGTAGFTHADWELFRPFISCPPDRPLTRYGDGNDGTKHLCAVAGLKGRGGQPCVIYSMGSAGNYLFEKAMLEATSCDIYTFDCTVDGAPIHPTRHFYHKWCIGDAGLGIASGLTYKDWDEVLRELHHDYVNLLKIDVEGHEYAVLAALQAGSQQRRVLPDEISIEIHARYVAWAQTRLEGSWQNGMNLPVTPGDMAVVFMHLANQGYGVFMSEENLDWSMCCSEFSLLRVPSAAAAAGAAGRAGSRSHRSSLERRRRRWRR